MKLRTALRTGGVFTASFLLLFGCAKRPAVSLATSPAPLGGAAAHAGPPAGVPRESPSASPTTTPSPAPSEFTPAAALQDIHFDFDKSAIRPEDATILDKDAEWMNANRSALILVEGHADERGTDGYNLALGDRRTEAVRDYLVARGVRSARISVISYGEERPVCTQHAESCWWKNRRAHFLVKLG